MQLYSYWRSTTSFRVRAALNLKGVAYETLPVNLLSGEQHDDGYAALNPGKGVPTLVLGDGTVLTQSMAILDYIEVTWPDPPLLPVVAEDRAKVLAAAYTMATDVHPVNNLRVVKALQARYGASDEDVRDWMRHWMAEGLTAYEALIRDDTPFSFGDAPDLADICLVAQLYNARRWGLDLAPYPKVARVEAACLDVPAFDAAHPDQQPDAEA